MVKMTASPTKPKKTKIKMSGRAKSTVAYLHGFIPEISFQNKYTRTRFLLLQVVTLETFPISLTI